MAYTLTTNAKYNPNVMGYYKDKLPFTAEDFYIQTISVSENARFTVEMPNIFTGYEVGYTDEDQGLMTNGSTIHYVHGRLN